jgi:two-component system response regulator
MAPVILFVEPDPDDEVLTVRTLRRGGIGNPVVVRRDGVEALEYLSALDADALPALILLDLDLPRLDGIELLRRIRADERMSHLPVVVLTASSADPDGMDGDGLGDYRSVPKPVGFADFADAVMRLGLAWRVVGDVRSSS